MTAWHIYNSLTGEQKIVAHADLAEFIFALAEEQMAYTFAWKEGFADWEPLAKIPELMVHRKKVPAPPPRGMRAPVLPDELIAPVSSPRIEIPEGTRVGGLTLETLPSMPIADNTVNFPESPTVQKSILIPTVKEETSGGQDRRESERLSTHLNVIITVDNTVIRTTTSDISKTGLSLEHPIPASMLKKSLELYISTPDSRQKLKMQATLVGDPKDARRFKFSNTTFQQVEQLEALIQSVKLINTKAS